MVVKPYEKFAHMSNPFENGVILYGSQTLILIFRLFLRFENGVILYGSQTNFLNAQLAVSFENGVILYGSQTQGMQYTLDGSLRMV